MQRYRARTGTRHAKPPVAYRAVHATSCGGRNAGGGPSGCFTAGHIAGGVLGVPRRAAGPGWVLWPPGRARAGNEPEAVSRAGNSQRAIGALTHAPKHSTSIQEQFPFLEISFSLGEIFSLQSFTILSAPRIKQGVVVHTWTKCLPTGAKLYMV